MRRSQATAVEMVATVATVGLGSNELGTSQHLQVLRHLRLTVFRRRSSEMAYSPSLFARRQPIIA